MNAPELVRNRAADLCDQIQGLLGHGNVAKTCAESIRNMPVGPNEPLPWVKECAAVVCDKIQAGLGFGRTAAFCAQTIRESPNLLSVLSPTDPYAMPVVRPEFHFSPAERERIEAAFDKAIKNSAVLSAYYGVEGVSPESEMALVEMPEPVMAQAPLPLTIGAPYNGLKGAIYAGIAPPEEGTPQAHLVWWPDLPVDKQTYAKSRLLAAAAHPETQSHIPTQSESALLYASLRQQIGVGGAWTSTFDDGTKNSVFVQSFLVGSQVGYTLRAKFRALAVSRLPVNL